MVLDFNARGYPEVKSEGFKGNFAFLFGSNGRNKSRLAVKNLRDTHATRAPSENQQQSSDNTAQDHQNTTENSGDFKYDETETNLCSRMVH